MIDIFDHNNKMSKLTEDQVLQIRELRAAGVGSRKLGLLTTSLTVKTGLTFNPYPTNKHKLSKYDN